MCGLFEADIQGEYQSNKQRMAQWFLGSSHTHNHVSDAIRIPSQWSPLFQSPNT